jgi:hypothetical protein
MKAWTGTGIPVSVGEVDFRDRDRFDPLTPVAASAMAPGSDVRNPQEGLTSVHVVVHELSRTGTRAKQAPQSSRIVGVLAGATVDGQSGDLSVK